MKNVPRSLVTRLKEIEKKVVSYPLEETISTARRKLRDVQENRELLVIDKYGNQYYQYYNNFGVPSKRMVHLNMQQQNKWSDEPLMASWLQGREQKQISQEELEKKYLEHEEFVQRCIAWDKQEEALIASEKARKKIENYIKPEKQEEGLVSTWDPKHAALVSRIDPGYLIENKEEDYYDKYVWEMNKLIDRGMLIKTEKERNAPLMKAIGEMNALDYHAEQMNLRFREKKAEWERKLNEDKKATLEVGKKMMAQHEKNKIYADFKNRFSKELEQLDKIKLSYDKF